MRTLLLLFTIGLVVSGLHAQTALRDVHSQQVRAAVQAFGHARPKVTVLTPGLMVLRGKVVGSNAWSFDLKSGGRVFSVDLDNVLELEGGGASLSFVPEPATAGYGSWTDAGGIFPNTKILVVLADGKAVKAFSNSASPTHLITVDAEGRERLDILATRSGPSTV